MKVVLTGASGGVGKVFLSMYPDTVAVKVRSDDPASMANLVYELRNSDVLIHAAANLNPISHKDALRDNVFLPMDILEVAGKLNPKLHVILLSSMSMIHSDGKTKTIPEMTLYASSKFIMEEYAKKYHGVPVTIVRFSTLFYEDPERDGLSKMIYTSKTMGKVVAADCQRDFIPVPLACKMLKKICENYNLYNKTINLCTGQAHNMVNIAEYLVNKYGVSFHRTVLPVFADICSKFDSEPALRLVNEPLNIYDVIDSYYNKIEIRGEDGDE